MTEDGTTDKSHRDRWCRCDRSNVQPVDSCNGFVANIEALGFLIPLQFSIPRVGAEAFTAMFQKLQAPFPVIPIQIGICGTAPHGRIGLVGMKARTTGQSREVLQQDIQGSTRWFALFHQPFSQAAANG